MVHIEYGNVNRLKRMITKRSVKSSWKTGYAISVWREDTLQETAPNYISNVKKLDVANHTIL